MNDDRKWAMTGDDARASVRVVCDDCAFINTYSRLRDARVALSAHERETGHAVDWRIGRLSAGVERAGDAAGVCGIPGTADPGNPLVEPSERRDPTME